PHLFQEVRQPTTDYVGIPVVVSETRRYYTVESLPPTVIAGNKLFCAVDPEGILFGLISSSMFITWQRTVGGRLKSDLSFANTITWNNFPVPKLEESSRQAIIKAGKGVLEARALHPDRCFAVQDNPLAMDPVLIKAHDELDAAVDRAFGASRKLTNERQRLEILFSSYEQLTVV